MTANVLIIDDDQNTAQLVKVILKPRDVTVHHATDGQEGLKLVYEIQPDLIILDIMMPGMDGFEVCSRIREFSDVPVLMFTAKVQCSDVKRGFAVGADDYVKKPFANEELLARIDYLLKRSKNGNGKNQSSNAKEYSDGVIRIDFVGQKVYSKDQEIYLTQTEYKLLEFLAKHPNKTLTIRAILSQVWGDAYTHDKSLLSFYIHQLRQKLDQDNIKHKYIRTQWGQGYWFEPPPLPIELVSEPASQEQKKERNVLPAPRNRWIWLSIFCLIFLVTFVAFQKDITLAFSKEAWAHTTIEAYIEAEGFRGADLSGVRGEICVENTGKNPTENLFIANTVQIHSKAKVRYISSTVDLNSKPVLLPGKSQCYPFGIAFDPMSEPDAQYRVTTMITISNHTGLLPGSKYCPGPELCPYGPEISTLITFSE